MNSISLFFQHFFNILVESSPWLLLGFFIAGIVKALIPTTFLHHHLGNNSIYSVIKGAMLGAPLPLCSCGVIPAALGIRRAGASKAATTSFLIATPETGIDSVSITYALLGPLMAVIRPIAAVTTAISAGLAVLWLDSKNSKDNVPDSNQNHSCCSAKTKPETSSCCSSKQTTTPTLWDKIRSGLRFTFIDLIKDTSIWLLIGLILAALIMTVIPAECLATWGASPYAYVVMALIGVPMYICAVASTPIAAGLLFAGVSPGAILVFLLVGPATNVATVAIVRKEMGNRVLTIYLSCIVMMGFTFGWITDGLAQQFAVSVSANLHNHQHTSIVGIICAVLFAGLLLNGLRKQNLHRPQKMRVKTSLPFKQDSKQK